MKGRIGLITILSDDVHSMKEFYRNVLGFDILEDLGRYVEFLNDGSRFAICSREVMYNGARAASRSCAQDNLSS